MFSHFFFTTWINVITPSFYTQVGMTGLNPGLFTTFKTLKNQTKTKQTPPENTTATKYKLPFCLYGLNSYTLSCHSFANIVLLWKGLFHHVLVSMSLHFKLYFHFGNTNFYFVYLLNILFNISSQRYLSGALQYDSNGANLWNLEVFILLYCLAQYFSPAILVSHLESR